MRIESTWDVAELAGDIRIDITDDGAPANFEVAIAQGDAQTLFSHTDISSVESDYVEFANALETLVNAASSQTHAISFAAATGYTWTCSGTVLSLSFTAMSDATEGTRMRQILGFSGDKSGTAAGTGYSSDVRPYYLIHPYVDGRSQVSDEYERSGLVEESVGDDGTDEQQSVDTQETWIDWVHLAEVDTAPALWTSGGTPVFIRSADAGTSAHDVPWSWQHLWRHVRAHDHRLLVVDDIETSGAVMRMRAEGGAFRPSRWTGADQPLWQVPMRCRLIGRL